MFENLILLFVAFSSAFLCLIFFAVIRDVFGHGKSGGNNYKGYIDGGE